MEIPLLMLLSLLLLFAYQLPYPLEGPFVHYFVDKLFFGLTFLIGTFYNYTTICSSGTEDCCFLFEC